MGLAPVAVCLVYLGVAVLFVVFPLWDAHLDLVPRGLVVDFIQLVGAQVLPWVTWLNLAGALVAIRLIGAWLDRDRGARAAALVALPVALIVVGALQLYLGFTVFNRFALTHRGGVLHLEAVIGLGVLLLLFGLAPWKPWRRTPAG
jgi:hypothetical protein